MLLWSIRRHWKVFFFMTLLEFRFIYSWNVDKRLKWLSFSSVFTLSPPCHRWSFYVKSFTGRRPCNCTCGVQIDSWGGHGSAELTIKGPAVIQSAITSRATSNPLTAARLQWHISVLLLTGMYQRDGLASQKIFHQDPNILCNHPHYDI